MLNLLCGLLRPGAGSLKIDAVRIESHSVRELAQKVAVVRQEFVPVFDFTVAEVAMMARTPYLPALGFETKADRKIVANALAIKTRCRSPPLRLPSGREANRDVSVN